ncbi:MAG TPA: hypothetical protein VN740_02160 [Solirubrobacteraceae bacterium]|nr:hypothetical protein [Solirubrobacteraceae bacterium]
MRVLAVSSGLEAVGGFLVLALGYGTVWGLWHFVFSPRNRHDDDQPPAGGSQP